MTSNLSLFFFGSGSGSGFTSSIYKKYPNITNIPTYTDRSVFVYDLGGGRSLYKFGKN